MTDEQMAREWLIDWNRKHALHPSQDDCVNSLAALLAQQALEARLDEARWWRVQTHEGAICSPQDCIQCKHVAKLAERASKGAAGGVK